MDWSLHVGSTSEFATSLTSLNANAVDAGAKLAPVVELTTRLIDEYFGAINFSRWVYGNEFCEHLIPTPERLEQIIDAADERGVQLTFLTPYCSDAGIEALIPLFDLMSSTSDCEVVFNDWGVLNVLRRDYSGLRAVQ